MIFISDYYRAEKAPNKKTRYDVVGSTASYPLFERILINKRAPNFGGLSFYIVDRPGHWNGTFERKSDKALTKGEDNISSLMVPDPSMPIGFGDIKGTQDAILVLIKDDWKVIEIFIFRGQKNNRLSLYQLACDGELNDELNRLRESAGRFDQGTNSVTKPAS